MKYDYMLIANNRNRSRNLGTIVVTLVLALWFALPATAQDNQVIPGSHVDAVFYPAPPAGFNPLVASDDELAQYGFPPRPSPSEAVPYANWQKMMSSSHTRITNPKLEQTAIFNGPARNWKQGVSLNGVTNVTTDNWSGFAITAANNTFKVNNSEIVNQFQVPIAQQAFGVCNGGWDYSSQWAGFDGAFISNDVLQAGTEADAYCSGGSKSTLYSAWYEWYPNGEVRVSYPVVSPGDLMGVEVWYTTSAPHGHAYILNGSTQVYTTIGFDPPSGTTYLGNTAEWVEERPGVNGGLADLTNYVADQFNLDYAYNGSYYEPGSSPSGTTTYNITMTCPPWNPSSACPTTTDISVVDLYGTYTLWLYNEGPAER